MKDYIVKTLSKSDDRSILQQAYLALSMLTLMVAGIISLLNSGLGHKLLLVALVLFVIFIINSVLWAIIKTAVDNYLSGDLKKSKKK